MNNDLEPRKRIPVPKSTDRDLEMWRLYCGGTSQDAIARRYNVGQATVSRALRRVRDALPEDSRTDMIQREFALVNELREKMVDTFQAPAPPAFTKDGDALVDPRNGLVVEDLTTRLAAWDRIMKTTERLAKMLGLDAPAQVQTQVDARVAYILIGVDDEQLR